MTGWLSETDLLRVLRVLRVRYQGGWPSASRTY